MYKVRCKDCEYLDKGFCIKKKKNGNLVKIKENKPRTCEKYKENSKVIFERYLKVEQEKKRLRKLKLK
jgi:hypothetical protein